MDDKPLVLYHGQCRDGWCAAWIAKQVYPDAELRPVMYGTEPPFEAAAGRKVLLLDFCYPREDMLALAEVAHVRVLDHHKTAQAAMDGLAGLGKHPIVATFDMERSGAGITWDELASESLGCGWPGAAQRPWIVNYIEDRDLWALPRSREVNAFISTLPYGNPENVAGWDAAARAKLEDAIQWGGVALAAQRNYVLAVCENAVRRAVGDHVVPSVNAPQHEISEVLEHLLDLNPGAPYVHGWWQRADGMYVNSLRSRGDSDVSVVAKMFGGGGHKNAAGFQLALPPSTPE